MPKSARLDDWLKNCEAVDVVGNSDSEVQQILVWLNENQTRQVKNTKVLQNHSFETEVQKLKYGICMHGFCSHVNYFLCRVLDYF